MRLRTKFALVISICILLYFYFTTFSLSRLVVREQEVYLNDFQSTLSLFSKRNLEMRMSLIYSELGALIESPDFRPQDLLSRIEGGLAAELWEENKLIASTRTGISEPPPPGRSRWALVTPPKGGPPAIRWLGRYGQRVMVIDFKPEWLDGVLEHTHGALSQLVLSGGQILLETGPNSPVDTSQERFYDPETLQQFFSGHPGIAQTMRYKSIEGVNYVGTFLPLPVEPPLMITVMTPWSQIQQVIDSMYSKSAGLAAAFLLLSIGIGIGFSSTLTAPLQNLVAQTLEVAKGNFERHVTTSSKRKDEVGMLARSFDRMITELARLRSELSRSERLAALGQFSASLTHELKNPLANISANQQLIELKLRNTSNEQDKAAVNQALKYIRDETRRANGIVMNLMKFARVEKSPTTCIDLGAALRNSIGMLRTSLNDPDLKFEERLIDGPVYCLADADQIHEVVANLVGNAAHAVRETVGKTVTVGLDIVDSSAVIRVEDNGSGIPKDVQEHIFEPFFTTKKIGEGTGLGLAVCHGIVTTHGGKIELQSEPGKGTRFSVVIPLAAEKQMPLAA
jgi:signal transduction histidine kinase